MDFIKHETGTAFLQDVQHLEDFLKTPGTHMRKPFDDRYIQQKPQEE
jgi:hypothetical protein